MNQLRIQVSQPTAETVDQVVANLVVKLMGSRTYAHLAHLSTRKYSAHEALATYYDRLVPLVDTLVEAYQGKTNNLLTYENCQVDLDLKVNVFQHLFIVDSAVAAARSKLSDFSEIQSILDDVAVLISATKYKLNFLTE